jgi:hypothetical protein
MTMRPHLYIIFVVVISHTLFGQSSNPSSDLSNKVPLYILISSPVNSLTIDLSSYQNRLDNSLLNTPRSNYQYSAEGWKEYQQYLAIGSITGFGLGCVYGLSKTRSLNDGETFGVAKPIVVMVYGFKGALIGVAISTVVYGIVKLTEDE